MKLLLTSQGITTDTIKDKFLELVGEKPGNILVAYIITAAYGEPGDKSWIKENQKPLKKLGIKIRDVDLRGNNRNKLKKILTSADVVYVEGGNTFYLLYWIRKSGFDEIIPDLLKQGKVYVGVSAGSIVAGPSIEVAGWKGYDDPSVVELDSLKALNLVSFHIFAHYGPKWKELVKENRKKLKEELICLTDKQAVVVENREGRII